MDVNKVIKYVACFVVVMLVLAVCWFLFREPDVRDQRDRAADVERSLDDARREQQTAADAVERIERGISDSIERADEIERGIGEAESAISADAERRGECERIITDSESRIAESQRIIQSIRARARQN